MRNNEHSNSSNPEQQANTPEQVLRGVMERRGISWELDDSGGVEANMVRRDFLTPDGRMLRLIGHLHQGDKHLDSDEYWRIFNADWQLSTSRPLASAELLEMTNSRGNDERWQYAFDLLNYNNADQVMQGGSQIPVGASVVEALAATIEGSQPLGDSMYYATLPSGQDVKILRDTWAEENLRSFES